MLLKKLVLLALGAVMAIVLTGCGLDLRDPIPALGYSPANPLAGQLVVFSGQGSRSLNPNGRIKQYEWFVNGHFLGSDQNLSCRFIQEGSYTVFLRVTDNWGRIGEAWATVVVRLAQIRLTDSATVVGGMAEIALMVTPGVTEIIIGQSIWPSGLIPEPLAITWDPDRLWFASVISADNWEIRAKLSTGNVQLHARRRLGTMGAAGLVSETEGEAVAVFRFRALIPGLATVEIKSAVLRDKWGEELPREVRDGFIDVR